MSIVVGVHGIAQQLKGPNVLEREWEAPLRDGVAAAGKKLEEGALKCAFYGGLFRAGGTTRGDLHYAPNQVTEDEHELLTALWEEAARSEPRRVGPPDPNAKTRLATPGSVQAVLRVLAGSKFFAGITESALIGDLKQVRGYIRDAALRDAAQQAVDDVVDTDTRIIVAHSLGSVVAYEALHRFGRTPKWANVQTFVTLGSPLGIPNLIFHQLKPAPDAGRGHWPANIVRWTNISDDGDVVALTKQLKPLFGGSLVDVAVSNEATAHDIMPYLTAAKTGKAIADGLA
jgi:hypothetical protein